MHTDTQRHAFPAPHPSGHSESGWSYAVLTLVHTVAAIRCLERLSRGT